MRQPPIAIGPKNPIPRVQYQETATPAQVPNLLASIDSSLKDLVARLAPPNVLQSIYYDGKRTESLAGGTLVVVLTDHVNGICVWVSSGILELSRGSSVRSVPDFRWDATSGFIPPHNVFLPEITERQLILSVPTGSPAVVAGIHILQY